MTDIHRSGTMAPLPVLGWATFAGPRQAAIPSITDSPHLVYTTSGRAAIELALRVLDFSAGESVLVPTYHCPTMISPIVRLGGQPVFFPVTESGAPDMGCLERQNLKGVRVMLVAHYFGFVQPLSKVRAFCDAHGIALIEDCAHAFFGISEGRPVGRWGDLAIASLTKFFPVAEGGCLVATSRTLADCGLPRRGALAELKAALDVLELGARHGRFRGLNTVLRGIFALKELARGRRWTPDSAAEGESSVPAAADDSIDTTLAARLTRSSRWIAETAHRSRVVELRRRNYQLLSEHLRDLPGATVFKRDLPDQSVPYVFPLRVANPVERYRAMRAAKVPLFRWDRQWPGTPAIAGDHAGAWSVEMFQLACHQDLGEDEIRAIAASVRRIVTDVA